MNRFAVLDDDDDETVMPPTPPPKATKKAPTTAPVEPKNKAVKPQASGPAPANNRKAPPPAQNSGNFSSEMEGSKPNNRSDDHHHHSRHGERAGRGRGGRGGDRDAAAPRRRDFDRHSGTGRGREIAKGGSGGHNWGNEKAEALNAEKAPVLNEMAVDEEAAKADAEAELAGEEPKASGWGEEPKASGWGDVEAPKEDVPPPEPEVPTYTLDEYLAKKEQARANAELFGSVAERTVNEEDYAGLKTKDGGETDTFIALGSGKNSRVKKADQRSITSKTNQVVDLGFKNASLVALREGEEVEEGAEEVAEEEEGRAEEIARKDAAAEEEARETLVLVAVAVVEADQT
eukprot:CAMPEP_0182419212 /NCGR_PEP_ID=MMETSP1167-20130531/3624_1 /TAXON_ID=2988 /ORGANISM="Mallomonas Sp, Strain CCMP3275" /LENGTH=345 /DNA_ID=CAMNT_0024593929 /DNA_START=100 /DNA_END=1138 /DNA_ORIENTATION=-